MENYYLKLHVRASASPVKYEFWLNSSIAANKKSKISNQVIKKLQIKCNQKLKTRDYRSSSYYRIWSRLKQS